MQHPFELLRESLQATEPITLIEKEPAYTLEQIERAMRALPLDIVRKVKPDTPMGRVQRRLLVYLAERNTWIPALEYGSDTYKIPQINAANGLVARGFATLDNGIYTITPAGVKEAERKPK